MFRSIFVLCDFSKSTEVQFFFSFYIHKPSLTTCHDYYMSIYMVLMIYKNQMSYILTNTHYYTKNIFKKETIIYNIFYKNTYATHEGRYEHTRQYTKPTDVRKNILCSLYYINVL